MAESKESEGIFQLRIEKWSELAVDGGVPEYPTYCGFPWQLRADKSEEGELKVLVYSHKEEESNLWFCDASVDVFLVNQKEGGENHSFPKIDKRRFSMENYEDGILTTLDRPSLLMDPHLGFIKDDTIIVEVRMVVHSEAGTRFRNKIDFDISQPSPKADGVLIIDEKKVYVSKQLLAIQSPFFDRIFYGKFKEAVEPESTIKDVDYEEFEVLLMMLYRTGEQFDEENVEFILKLADRFEMMSILDDAESFLLDAEEPNIHTKLRLSEQYNLLVLRDQLLTEYDAALIRELINTPDYAMIKEATKDILFKKYIDFTTPR